MAASFMKGILSSPKVRSDSTTSGQIFSMTTMQSPRELSQVFENGTEAECLLTLASSSMSSSSVKDITFLYGANPLHIASRKGWVKVCDEFLTSHDCHVTDKDERGWTPLHYAVVYHQMNVIELLISKYKSDLLQSDIQGDTPIHLACHYGYQQVIEYFLSIDRLDLDSKNLEGNTPFHLACSMFLYMTQYLLMTRKVDLTKQTYSDHSPVRAACMQGRWETAIYLVTEQGCDPSGIDHYGNSLLHECSRRGQYDLLKIVASKKALDLSLPNRNGDTPLHIACRHAQSNIVDYLVSQEGVDLSSTNEKGFTPTQVACRHSNWQVGLKLILDNGCSPVGIDKEGNTYLHGACMTNNFAAVKHIVNTGTVPYDVKNEKGDTPLHIACYNGNMDVVNYLVSLAESLPMIRNEAGNTPLHFASMAGHADVIDFLLTKTNANQRSLNNSANTPLHLVCEFGHTEAAKTLVASAVASDDLDTLISLLNGQGKTPTEVALICQKWGTAVFMATLAEKYVPQVERHMHLFCAEGYYELIKEILTTLKVDVNCRDRFKNTPLHHACKSGSIDIIQYLLLEAKADPSCLNELHNAPIHTASLEGHLEAVRYLMSMRNVDPNCSNKEQNTPLHMACMRRHHDVVKFLLKSGRVDPFKTNKDGKTPLEILKTNSSNCSDLVCLFQSLKDDMVRYPVESYTKIIVCGNSMSGKSSISKVLSDRAGNRRRFSALGALGKKFVGGVVPETMGMVTSDVRTPEVDNMMVYDLSGHPRYHSSHVAYLRDLNRTSPAVFLLMVDIKLSDNEIKRQLSYWHSLIVTTCSPATPPSKLLVIGSHVDGLEKKDLTRIKTLLDDTMTDVAQSDELCQYVGNHFLNCSKLHSKRLLPFFNILTEVSESLKSSYTSSTILTPYCHALYSFLVNKIKEKAITLVNLVYRISSDESCLLPSQTHVLEQLLTCLRDRGLVNLLKPNDCSHTKWIVVDSQTICNNVIGNLFAPPTYSTNFNFHQITNGIVSVSNLENSFPQVPIHILVGVLQSLDLCYEVNVKALTQTPNNLNTVESPDRKRRLFFPNFLLLIEPVRANKVGGIGWCCFGSSPNQFLTPHLVHTLILRLLRNYCLPDVAADSTSSLVVEPVSSFEVWETGVSWVTCKGIDVTVKMSLNCQRISVTISFNNDTLLEHLKIRSSLLAIIRNVLNQFLPLYDFQEYFVPSSHVGALNRQEFEDLEFYNIKDIASSLMSGDTSVCLVDDHSAKLTDLLCDDPYLRLPVEHYEALHDPSLSSEVLTDELFEELNKCCKDILDDKIVIPSSKNEEEGEGVGRGRGEIGRQSTYELMREHLSYYTVLESTMATQGRAHSQSDCCLLYGNSDILALVQKLKTVEDWPLLGNLLGLNKELIDGLVSEKLPQEDAIRSLLTSWLESQNCVPNREMLKVALIEMKEGEVARLL